MEISDLTLWVLRLVLLGLVYLFLFIFLGALRAEVRSGASAAARPHAPAPVPAAAPTPTLVVTGGTQSASGERFALTRMLEIGRDAGCDIVLINRFVSGRHARVGLGAGGLVLEDLGSTNGTQLNGAPLTGTRPLRVGDRFVVGDTEFLVA